jgi:hypothetical protein
MSTKTLESRYADACNRLNVAERAAFSDPNLEAVEALFALRTEVEDLRAELQKAYWFEAGTIDTVAA